MFFLRFCWSCIFYHTAAAAQSISGSSGANAFIAGVLASVPQIEEGLEQKRKGFWWQRIGLTRDIRQEMRLQLLTQHTVYPKCGNCMTCTGFKSKNLDVRWVCLIPGGVVTTAKLAAGVLFQE